MSITVPDASPLRRRFLSIASIVCLVACVALMGMWARSYSWTDEFYFHPASTSSFVGASAVGRIVVGKVSLQITPPPSLLEFFHRPIAEWRTELAGIDQRWTTVAGFGMLNEANELAITMPYWFVVLVVGAPGFAPWSRVKYRFSLRTLFIATSILAIVLGMIAWLDRAWIEK
jgi:hypothetical protein